MTGIDACDTTGERAAPALVLLHGSVVSRQMWLPQLRDLSDSFHVVAVDLPGHGALHQIPFSLEGAARSVADAIDRHADGRALVAGLSLGGYVAIELGVRFPERVAGLVLCGASVNFTGALGAYLRVVSGLMRRGWLKQSRARAARRVQRLFPPALEDVARAQLEAGVFPYSLGPAFAAMAGTDFAARLVEYAGPVLLLNGSNDRMAQRGVQAFAAARSNVRVASLEGAGHACNLDQPAQWNAAVRAFADEIGWCAAR